MIAQDLLGKPLAEKINNQTHLAAEELRQKGVVPRLAILDATGDPASAAYARTKMRLASSMGVEAQLVQADNFLDTLQRVAADPTIHAIFIERPLPDYLGNKWMQYLPFSKDVEGELPLNLGRLVSRQSEEDFFYVPTTALACLEILKFYSIPISSQDIVIIGRSLTVGKPLSWLLLAEDATVTICHTKTKDLASHTKRAKIIISAAGQRHLIDSSMISEGAILVDVGLTYTSDGSVYGDVNYEDVRHKAQALTPARGGLGPVTTALLLRNVIRAAQYATKAPNILPLSFCL